MPTYHTFLTPSLTPNAVLDISLPTHWNPSSSGGNKSVADKSIVRQFELGTWKEEAPLGSIRKLAVREGIVALADSTNRITLAELPKPPKAPTLPSDGVVDETKPAVNAEEEDDDDDDEDLKIVDQFKVKGKKKGDNWVGLEMVDSGILSTTSSGLLTLNPHSSSTTTTTTTTTTTKTAKLPSGLKVAQSLGSSGDKIVVAGKEVDVSIYDTERVFAAGIDGADGVSGTGGKRKKGEMEVGEIWRAKALPNNHLNLRVPIHHLCMTLLPSSPGETNSTTTSIVTGTKSGHVRRYDTRQRKPVDGWKVAREGGIGAVSAGENEHELFFADTSSFLGSMDLRTGKLLYAYAAQTSTPHVLFPLPTNPTSSSSTSSTSASAFTAFKSKSEKNRIGLITLSSDYTLRACSTTAPPVDKRRNVIKGDVVGMIGGVGSGSVGYYGVMERDEGEDEEDEGEEGEFGVGSDEDEEVWDDMSVVRDDGEEEDEEDDEEDEESEAEGAKDGKRTRRG